MLNSLPTTFYPFLFAVIAAVAGAVLARSSRDQPAGFASTVLYAVAAGCVIIGVLTWYLQRA